MQIYRVVYRNEDGTYSEKEVMTTSKRRLTLENPGYVSVTNLTEETIEKWCNEIESSTLTIKDELCKFIKEYFR